MDPHEHESIGDMNTMDTCENLGHIQIYTDTYRHGFVCNNPYGPTTPTDFRGDFLIDFTAIFY